MIFTDSIPVSGVRRTADGYLVAEAYVARTGIQDYLGTEIDPNNDHGLRDVPVVKVYRPESSVFHADAMNSYAYRPMTNDHPGGDGVNSKNWKDVAVGNTGGEVIRDGQRVKVPLVLMDAKAITDFEAGKRQLSMGYGAEIIFQDGVTPEGDAYHVSLGPMKMNHLSLVHSARAGEEFRIGDHKPENPKGGHDMADSLRKLLVDGISIDVTEQGAQAIEKLAKQLNDAASATKTLTDAHATAIALKDGELAKKDAEIDDLKAKMLSDADVDKRVAARADLISKAKTIADADYTGKTDADIRKAVVVAKLGDAAVTGKSSDYVDARFEILVEDAAKQPGNDTFRQHMIQQDSNPNTNPAAAARAKMLEDLNSTQPAK
ncbi:DUF2213 domain-containing protein [Pseudomonas amygdali]|uniref:DUF2213 domain-containing protein n=1 Tax=Pseudomonas amygdali pv. hibisci TaxID=251723 RepID=A0AB34UBL7_PSEA0|nr:DUF2213 domain-containing protein [Pseudomonas amygdali]KPX57083.1 Uncharacterized protein ALO67_02292 [Pseudomonas amygdali pv. hibisci]RMN61821.1 hypothetical protein ALQ57_02618 [Pseudomonas amygdali pv. hibisci]UBT78799.1 DUF2213 domain-containing protein [Pseudomonas amygdali]